MTIEQDLNRRDELRRYLNERSLESLGDRFKVSPSAVWLAEKRPLAVLTDEENSELQQLRREYHAALEEFNNRYRLGAIAEKHGHGVQWVCKKRRKMLDERAEVVYGRRIAA